MENSLIPPPFHPYRRNYTRYNVKVLDENGRVNVILGVPENKLEMTKRAWPTIISITPVNKSLRT